MTKEKVLIVRFSSFGDIVQNSSVVELIRKQWPKSEIHWVTRSEFVTLVELNNSIDKVYSINKSTGFKGLFQLALKLRKENYTHIYDSHNNLRSTFIKLFLLYKWSIPFILVRSKDRIKRILLFHFKINLFPKPFRGIDSYISPLITWGIKNDPLSPVVKWNFNNENLALDQNFITLVPSAAWEMKRWPIQNWIKLVLLLPNFKIVILGGKEDVFCEDIRGVAPDRVINYAGKLSLIDSCYVISKSKFVVSGDTGLLHVADVLSIPGLSLMGPTAFGFTMSDKIKTIQVELDCRPCSKDGSGKCSQDIYQKCMTDITPERVAREVKNYFLL
jgi:heptosyltransferase-2